MARKEGQKRAFDMALCLLSLPFVLPVLAISGILIKLDSPGAVFFRQERLGRNRKPFEVIKLRTMVENAEHMGAGLYAVENDPRYTRIGPTLRRFSLDELAQVFNVLQGQMSLVGPRPLPAVVVDEYPDEFDIILKVKPGITGLSQIGGRNELPRSERLRLDMLYADNWSVRQDLQIIMKTVGVVATGAGQLNYQSQEDVER